MAPLKDKYMAVCEAIETLRDDMFAKMEAARSEEGSSEDEKDWFHSPAMKAKRALDAKIEELRTLKTHVWVASRLGRDEQGTLAMFRKRCPKCKAEPLAVRQYQT